MSPTLGSRSRFDRSYICTRSGFYSTTFSVLHEEEANELEILGLLESDSDPSPQSPDEIDDRDMTVRRDEIAKMMWEG